MQKKVRIISPSGSIDPTLITQAADNLRQQGFDVVIGKHALGAVGRFAGTEEERLHDLNEALADSSCQFILCARGGYGLMQILDKVHVPTNAAPTIIGFSDITALHCLMGHHSLPSIHGVMCKHIAEGLGQGKQGRLESAEALLRVMNEEDLCYQVPAHAYNKEGVASGTLRGGNLSLIYGLQGSPYACPVHPGDILFIEDVGEHPYAIDRMMQNLRLSGILSQLGGLIVGQFSDYEEDPRMPYTVYEGIRQMVEPYQYPVLFDFPAGHVERNFPLILNATCQLQVSAHTSILRQSHV